MQIKGPVMCALAPNRKGAENMLIAGIRKINFVLSVSEEHNKANVNKTVDASFAQGREDGSLVELELLAWVARPVK